MGVARQNNGLIKDGRAGTALAACPAVPQGSLQAKPTARADVRSDRDDELSALPQGSLQARQMA